MAASSSSVTHTYPGSPVQLSCELRGPADPCLDHLPLAIASRTGLDLSPVDVTDDEALRRVVDAVAGEDGAIDVLVNNAGYGSMTEAARSDLAEWRRMVEVNINGVLSATHAALPHLTRAATGERGIADVVTVSSVAGRKVAFPAANVYAATKHAVGAFSEALRQELAGAHVRVGLVEPGLVRSELTEGNGAAQDAEANQELGLMEPDDIADAVVHMVTRPRRAAVNEMLVRPTEQVR